MATGNAAGGYGSGAVVLRHPTNPRRVVTTSSPETIAYYEGLGWGRASDSEIRDVGLIPRGQAEVANGRQRDRGRPRNEEDDTPKDTQSQRDAYASVMSILNQYDLGELAPYVEEWTKQNRSPDEIMLMLRDPSTEAGKIFDARFPAIQLRNKAGLSPISPTEYVTYERDARQAMLRAGMPASFYDNRRDFTNLLVNDISLPELQERIEKGYQRVAQTSPELRQTFKDWFGVEGDGALASFFLNPDKAMPVLERMVGEAEIGSVGRRFGFTQFSRDTASRLFGIGVDYAAAQRGFEQIDLVKPLFRETIDEGVDLTPENEGVDLVFGTGGPGGDKVKKRLNERVAKASGGGSAAISNTGIVGLGAARRQ